MYFLPSVIVSKIPLDLSSGIVFESEGLMTLLDKDKTVWIELSSNKSVSDGKTVKADIIFKACCVSGRLLLEFELI
jgi:hypothetical protein